MAAAISTVERLGSLIAYLLAAAPEGRTAREICAEVPGYAADHESARVQFNRDKRMLQEEGIEVESRSLDGGEHRYYIDPDRFYLPDLGLTDDEVLALHMALAAVHFEGGGVADPRWRFGAAAADTDGCGIRLALSSSALLPRLADAVARRRVVRFRYGGRDREVEPHGLLFRDDFWYLSGLDRTRGAQRNFRVDRIEGKVIVGEPWGFERPPGYDAAAALPDQPWRLGGGDPVATDVWVDAVRAHRAVHDAGEDAVVRRFDDGAVVVRLPVTNVEGLRSWLFGFLDHAVVLGPAAVRDEVVAWLEGMRRCGPDDGRPEEVSDGARRGGRRAGRDAPGRRPATEQLLRILRLVPWVIQRGGRVRVAEVARHFGITCEQAREDAERASLVGVAPFDPGSYVDAFLDDERDEIVVGRPPFFDRAPRLSVSEGFAVLAAGKALLAVPGAEPTGALGSALAKLERVLGDTSGIAVEVALPPYLDAVRSAVAEGRRLRVRYYSAWRDVEGERRIEPHVVYEWGGRWYVDAHSPETGDVRHYRVDRIRELSDTGERFEPVRAEPPVRPFDPPPDAWCVVVEAPAARARWVTETYDCDWEAVGDRLRITLTVAGTVWLERLLLRLGPEAAVVSPPELRRCGAEVAGRVLARYAEVGTGAGAT